MNNGIESLRAGEKLMAIDVYTLNNAIITTSVEEYLAFKADLKEQKRQYKMNLKQHPELAEKQSADPAGDQAFKTWKDRRTVFVTTPDTAREALHLAGISYDGDIDLDDIQFCKIEAQHDCMLGNLHIPKLNDVLGDKFRMLFFVNRKNIVIVDDQGFANKIIARIIASHTKPGQSRERFLYSFCTKFMDKDLENLGHYSKKIMQIEEDVRKDDDEGVIATIAQLRKELLVLREYYDELRDLGKMLEENENHFFSGKNLEYFGIISDRADRLMGRTMYLLDYVGQVRETYQGMVAEEQSENMKFLTIISTIFYPLTLITGWYGMNFQNMPELAQGYPFVIILSIVVITIITLVCKKRKIF